MVRKEKLTSMKELNKQLDTINKFNVGTFGKDADAKNASVFKAKNIKSAGKFGSGLVKNLKKSKELDF